jgi:glycosyltransferase involved in cell wall biosynthesis
LIAEGTSGLLAPVDDAAALARAIRRLDSEDGLAGKLATGGRTAYQADFTEQAVVGRYLELFERLGSFRPELNHSDRAIL